MATRDSVIFKKKELLYANDQFAYLNGGGEATYPCLLTGKQIG